VVFLAIAFINLNGACPYSLGNQKEVSSILDPFGSSYAD
jgi:hypothetical protein